MLKGLAVRSDEIEAKTKDERLTAMQGQLDELRRLKVLRLSRIEEGSYGLLDSGATNPMRGKKKRRRFVSSGRGPGDFSQWKPGSDEDDIVRCHGG